MTALVYLYGLSVKCENYENNGVGRYGSQLEESGHAAFERKMQ